MPRSGATEPVTPAVSGPDAGDSLGGYGPRGAIRSAGDGDSVAPNGGGARVPSADGAAGVVGDDILVRRLRGGEAAAGEVLCKRYAQPLLRYLQRLVGDAMAEELHQQTWLSVLDNLDKFDAGPAGTTGHKAGHPAGASGGGFKAWLFRIATNKANDHWRSRGREKAAKEGLRLVTDEELPHAGHRLEGTEQEQKLRRAIEKLPDAQRQVLLLRYYGNMKFVDIAKTLGCPLNTALGRVHKAMIKLRQLMEE